MRTPVSIFLLILGLACLWGAARVQRSLLEWRVNASREAADLDRSPPLVVFTTVAIGGFRGMLADLLWMRAIRLQEEDKVFELAQLADWITKLEPRFVTVWAYNAWNLAYNVSIRFPDPEDRWRWVSSGIRLLRDEGLRFNPRSAILHRELGWLYQHKIGFYLDPAHVEYKWKLAQEMAALFDGPRPDYPALRRDPRRTRLLEESKLYPAVMEEIDRACGPLDWRLPATHAVYWAYRGRRVAASGPHNLGCEYMLCQCLAESFRHGRLVFVPPAGLYLATPDLDLLPQVLKAYEQALARYPREIPLNFSFANFLGEAATILFAYHRVAEAGDLYQRLIRQVPAGQAPEFEAFLLGNLRVGMEEPPPRDAVALVEGFLVQHYTWLARGNEGRAADCDRLACLIWTRLLELSPFRARWDQTGLAPLEDMRREAYRRAVAEAPDASLAARLLALPPDGVTAAFWP